MKKTFKFVQSRDYAFMSFRKQVMSSAKKRQFDLQIFDHYSLYGFVLPDLTCENFQS